MESELTTTSASGATTTKSTEKKAASSPPAPAAAASAKVQKQPITMLADRVLVQVPPAEGERKSRAGILIPATAQVSKRLVWAEVAAVGPHVRTIRAGDAVLYNPDESFEVDVSGEDYLILRERDIHAVAAERLDNGTGLYL